MYASCVDQGNFQTALVNIIVDLINNIVHKCLNKHIYSHVYTCTVTVKFTAFMVRVVSCSSQKYINNVYTNLKT